MRSLAPIVKAIRHSYGASGDRFARRLGVSVDALRSWESGRARPDAANILKLADIAPVELVWEILKEAGITRRRVRKWLRA